MSTPLSAVPAAKRRHLAATLGLFSVLFLAVGAVAATGARTTVLAIFAVFAFVVAVVLAFLGWGVLSSVRVDAAAQDERSVDDAIAEAMAAHGMSGCGHEHDPSELHVTDDPCERDGHGAECTHTCETCVLATLRSDNRPRPRPTPR